MCHLQELQPPSVPTKVLSIEKANVLKDTEVEWLEMTHNDHLNLHMLLVVQSTKTLLRADYSTVQYQVQVQ